jgi:cytochrome c peroxidase
LPAKVPNPAKVELGKKLYFDPRLSRRASSPATPATT